MGLYTVGSLRSKRRIPIIAYHSIDESGSPISKSPSDFVKEMKYIKENEYRTLTLSELVGIWQRKVEEPQKVVVLTFDDGFLNNYDVAFPIMKALGFTATVFLTTDFIGKKCTWDKKEDIPDLPLLSWDMVKEMHHYGIDFQPHGATHPHLVNLTVQQIEEEITKSRNAIEDKLGKKCNLFCYPYGEFNGKIVNVLKKLKFTAAVAKHQDEEDLYYIRRVNSTHLTTSLAYKTALIGTFLWYYTLKRNIIISALFKK